MVKEVDGSAVKVLQDSNGRCKGNGKRRWSNRKIKARVPYTPPDQEKRCGKNKAAIRQGKRQSLAAKKMSFEIATVSTETVKGQFHSRSSSAKTPSVISLEQVASTAENSFFAKISKGLSCSHEELVAYDGLYLGES